MDDEVGNLIKERTKTHGDAWSRTGQVLDYVSDLTRRMLTYPSFLYPWINILCKWIRAAHTPMVRDHWVDIAGYAMLVAKELEGVDEDVQKRMDVRIGVLDSDCSCELTDR